MKASRKLTRTRGFDRPHPSLGGEVGRRTVENSEWRVESRGAGTAASHSQLVALNFTRGRRAQPNWYPDFGLRALLPPSRPWRPVAVGVCSPLQWRYRPGFTPGSLTFDCVTDLGGTTARSKNRLRVTRQLRRRQEEFWKTALKPVQPCFRVSIRSIRKDSLCFVERPA
jgi:hypothetical protein